MGIYRKLIAGIVVCAFAAGVPIPAYPAAENVSVVYFYGDIKIVPSGQTEPVKCREGMALGAGDAITTGKNSYLEIAFGPAKKNIMKLEEKTSVVIVISGDDKVELVDGMLVAALKNIKPGKTFQIRTPTAVCGARGTGWVTSTNGKITEITVFENRVFMRGINKDGSLMKEEYWTEAGYKRRARRFRPPQKKIKFSRRKLADIKEDALLSGDERKILENRLKGSRSDLIDERKMSRINSRMEEAASRMHRTMDMGPTPGSGALPMMKRGGRDDDRDRK